MRAAILFGVQSASPHAPQTGCALRNSVSCPVDGSEKVKEIRPGARTSLIQFSSKSKSTSLGEARCTRG